MEMLAGVWERSVALLEAQAVARARSLLHLLSTFAQAPVPVALLLPGVICAEQELGAAVNGLLGFGLVRVECDLDALVQHSLVRELVAPLADSWVPMRDKLLFEVAKTTSPVDRALGNLLLPHCELLAERGIEVAADSGSVTVGALFWAGRHAEEAASWEVAERMHSVALRWWSATSRTSGTPSPFCANGERTCGRKPAALRPSALRALRSDFTSLTTWHNHAMVLLEQGEFARARAEFTELLPLLTTGVRRAQRRYRLALDLQKEVPGPDHPDTLRST